MGANLCPETWGWRTRAGALGQGERLQGTMGLAGPRHTWRGQSTAGAPSGQAACRSRGARSPYSYRSLSRRMTCFNPCSYKSPWHRAEKGPGESREEAARPRQLHGPRRDLDVSGSLPKLREKGGPL